MATIIDLSNLNNTLSADVSAYNAETDVYYGGTIFFPIYAYSKSLLLNNNLIELGQDILYNTVNSFLLNNENDNTDVILTVDPNPVQGSIFELALNNYIDNYIAENNYDGENYTGMLTIDAEGNLIPIFTTTDESDSVI